MVEHSKFFEVIKEIYIFIVCTYLTSMATISYARKVEYLNEFMTGTV